MPTTTTPLTIDPETDDLRPVASLAESLTGRKPAPATVWRWCQKGKRHSGKLPALRVFGTWHTTRAALLTWLCADSTQVDETPTESSDRSESTSRRLAEAGLI